MILHIDCPGSRPIANSGASVGKVVAKNQYRLGGDAGRQVRSFQRCCRRKKQMLLSMIRIGELSFVGYGGGAIETSPNIPMQ